MSKYKAMIEAMEGAQQGSYDLDRRLWGLMNCYDWPLAGYQDREFTEAARDGDRPETSLSTSADSALAWLMEDNPDVQIDIEISAGRVSLTAVCAYEGKTLFSVISTETAGAVTQMPLLYAKAGAELRHQSYQLRLQAPAEPG